MKKVSTALKKDKSMKIRINENQKAYFKQVAHDNGMDLSEMVLVATQLYAEHKEEQLRTAEGVTARAEKTEKKLQELKEKMKLRKENSGSQFNILKLFKK